MPDCVAEPSPIFAPPPSPTTQVGTVSPARSPAFHGGIVLAVLLALSGLMAFARLHTFHEALEIDQTIYAVIAHEMKAGRALYADLWDHKPPAIFLTYAAGEAICGYGPRSIYFLGLAASVLTLIGVYAAGSAHPWGRAAGLWAAALWAVASGDLYLEADQPNTEDFINPCLIGAFALWVWGREKPWGLGRTVLIGVLFALASLYKHVVVIIPLILACVHVALPPGGPTRRKQALRQMALVAIVGAVAWAIVGAYFVLRGESRAFLDAVFRFNRAYAGNPLRNILAVTAPIHWVNPRQVMARLAIVLAGVVFIFGWMRGPARLWVLWGALALGVHAAVAAPGKLFPHYFQLWLPAGAVGIAWLAGSVREVGRPMAGRLAHLVCAVIVGTIVVARMAEYALPADRWIEVKYARYDPHWAEAYAEARDVGRRMDEILRPKETFYVWGHVALPYYESRRHPPSGVLYDGPILDGPLQETLTERLLADLEVARPELIVDVTPLWADEARNRHPVRRYWEARYRPLAGEKPYRAVRLYMRRGGALEARRKAAGFLDSN